MRTAFVALMVLTAVAGAFAADQVVRVAIDGSVQAFNPPAVVRGGKAYVPLRQVGNALGCKVDYQAATQTIVLDRCGQKTVLKQSDGITINGSMFVPLRKVSEAFGHTVKYDGALALVSITAPAPVPVSPLPPVMPSVGGG